MSQQITFTDACASSAGYNLLVVFEYAQHNGAEAILLLALGLHDQAY